MRSNHPTLLWVFIAVSVFIIALFVVDVAKEPADVSADMPSAVEQDTAQKEVIQSDILPEAKELNTAGLVASVESGSAAMPELNSTVQATGEQLSPPIIEVFIEIRDMKLLPQEITVRPGTTVTWVNNDGKSHKVFEITRKFYGTRMETGDRFSFTFDVPGTYRYFDANFEEHKGLRGTINVEDASPILITGDAVSTLSRQEDNSKFSAILVMSAILSVAVVTLIRTRRYH
ncbi:hypothetical protein HYU13_00900 [Candidatus Woesearchaeota archaeon]|nr:hypothetical protein [Candidatus Woesearchaeota archaeon]